MHTPRGLIVKNKHLTATDSCQVYSKNSYSKTPTITTMQIFKIEKAQYYWTFRQNKNHLPIKFFLSIDGRIFGGGGGSRTPVRKKDQLSLSERSSCFEFRSADAQRTGFFELFPISFPLKPLEKEDFRVP